MKPSRFFAFASICLITSACSNATLRGDSDTETEVASETEQGSEVAQSSVKNEANVETAELAATDIEIKRVCGLNLAVWQKQEYLEQAKGAVIKLKPKDGGATIVINKDPAAIKAMIIDQAKVSVQVPDGTYQLDICNADSANCLDPEKFGRYPGSFLASSSAQVTIPIDPATAFPVSIWVKKEFKGKGPECDKSTPLILDLGKKGIYLSSPRDGVSFDINADGIKDQISWPTSADNFFLTLDVNNNGQIDNASELFGDSSVAPDGSKSTNGFIALGKYDSNRDNVIDASDVVYSKLRLWFDANRNGISENKELYSLKKKQVKAIATRYKNMYSRDMWANSIEQYSAVEMMDGNLRLIYDVYFMPERSLYSQMQNK